MNCVIPGANLRILGKAIQALAKIGDELHYKADEDKLSLRTVNVSTTVFGSFNFFNPFFTHYKINDSESISCKIPMKALLGIFKSPNQMEKQIETCKIELNNHPTKILFKFRYKQNITKTQNVWLYDGDETLEMVNLTETESNTITAASTVYTHALANFQLTDGEVSFEVTPLKLILRNYVLGEPAKVHNVRSQLSLCPTEFISYKIVKNTTITFSLRPFRAAIQFAENFNVNITLSFEQAGKPAEIKITNNITFEGGFTLATMNTDGETQTASLPKSLSSNLLSVSKNNSSGITWEINSEDVQAVYKNKEIINTENQGYTTEKNRNDSVIQENNENDNQNEQNILQSPVLKKMRFHFQRCFEPTFNGNHLNDEEIYAENSDPEMDDF